MIIIELETKNREYADQLCELSDFYFIIESPRSFCSDQGRFMQIAVKLRKNESDVKIEERVILELIKNSEMIRFRSTDKEHSHGGFSEDILQDEIYECIESGKERWAMEAIGSLLQTDQISGEEDIGDYLAAVMPRVMGDGEVKRDRKFTEICFSDIIKSVVKDCPHEILPQIIVDATYDKRNLFISSSRDNDYYIFYDCHTSDRCDTLNRIFLGEYLSYGDVLKFCYEMLREEEVFQLDDTLLNYYSLRLIGLGKTKFDDNVIRSGQVLTEGQDLYRLGYEIGKWLYAIGHSNSDFVSSDIREEVMCRREETMRLLQEISVDTKKMEECYPWIIEACFADSVAYKYVMEHPGYADIQLRIAQALLMGLLNLQTIELPHIAEQDYLRFENHVRVRILFFHQYVGRYFSKNKKAYEEMYEQTWKEYNRKIIRVAEGHYRKLREERKNIEDCLAEYVEVANDDDRKKENTWKK